MSTCLKGLHEIAKSQRPKRKFPLILLLPIVFLGSIGIMLAAAWWSVNNWDESPCPTRYTTEKWYLENQWDGTEENFLRNATFTPEELRTLTLEEACPDE